MLKKIIYQLLFHLFGVCQARAFLVPSGRERGAGYAAPAVLALCSHHLSVAEFGCLYPHAGSFDETHKTGRRCGPTDEMSVCVSTGNKHSCGKARICRSGEALVTRKRLRHRDQLRQLETGVRAVSSWGTAKGEVVTSAVRGTHVGVTEWTGRRAVAVRSALADLSAEVGRRTETAFSTVRLRRPGREALDGGVVGGERLDQLTDEMLCNVVDVVRRDGWEHVTATNGVVVHRQFISFNRGGQVGAGDKRVQTRGGEASQAGSDSSSPPQFACVKATAVLDAPADVVYRLFADNSRVGEYNEHCREVEDLETLNASTKITWAASGRMGPFKARDFCTLVHFRTLSDGTYAQVSRPVEHARAPRSNRYVRSEVLLAGNFMRPVPGDPSKTEFLMVTHVNPGGAAESRAGAMLVNSLCASSPVSFICRLEAAAQRLARELGPRRGPQQGPVLEEGARAGDIANGSGRLGMI
ncbi:unnamed protein product [Discosporangium mesarthrocarpum]